jgi:ubiquinone/menaquinone biosynthesis C-methylase UbiE
MQKWWLMTTPPARARDPYRYINEVDEQTIEALVTRLEFRGRDPVFAGFRDRYLAKIDWAKVDRILEVGCGTGVVARALACRTDFHGDIVATDQSQALLRVARQLAEEEGVVQRIEFTEAHASSVPLPADSFELAIAHTIMSHVENAPAVLRELARLVKRTGKVVIFDGDYASFAFAHPEAGLARSMEDALVAAVIHQPRVMRDLPSMLPSCGLHIVEVIPQHFAEVGESTFFVGAAEAYSAVIKRAGLADPADVDRWARDLRVAADSGTFFGSCTYYSYILAPEKN